MTKEQTKEMVIELCRAVMSGVVKSGVIDENDPGSTDRAVEIMREEVRAFLDPRRGEYKDERRRVANGSMLARVAVASVISRCVLRIQGTTLKQGERVLQKKDFDDVVKETIKNREASDD